ncbi:chaperone for outer membrane proteins, Skp family [Gillisia sp. Hel1_33_143]|uniref:OmpH family outer membrane protein n=1 Tax=unclassified Gillisia TaxID=2615025 RepID=UPI000559984F|nr:MULTISPECIES: OmpH family outer membrane protein [unclassified Gillisia]SDR71185.1 chaperone for outer membrane proteins, Skp family [Gillisia sp. Hel1_33_143]
MNHLRLILISCALGLGLQMQAQKPNRIAYIDMEYILQNVPEYQQASVQLETRVQQWKNELDTDLKKVEGMKIALEQERPLLTKELIEEREATISFEESKIAEYQQKRFGPNGDLILQKKQLIKPIQDQVFNAIQEMGELRKYDFIFDRTSNMGMVFSAEKHNISDQVLRIITRSANREQLSTRKEIAKMEEEEGRTVEEDLEITEKKQAAESAQNEREAYIEQRKKERDSIRSEKQRAFEERRAKVLEERQRKKDSIDNVRKQKIEAVQKSENNN